jgi:hypothetical protein
VVTDGMLIDGLLNVALLPLGLLTIVQAKVRGWLPSGSALPVPSNETVLPTRTV